MPPTVGSPPPPLLANLLVEKPSSAKRDLARSQNNAPLAMDRVVDASRLVQPDSDLAARKLKYRELEVQLLRAKLAALEKGGGAASAPEPLSPEIGKRPMDTTLPGFHVGTHHAAHIKHTFLGGATAGAAAEALDPIVTAPTPMGGTSVPVPGSVTSSAAESIEPSAKSIEPLDKADAAAATMRAGTLGETTKPSATLAAALPVKQAAEAESFSQPTDGPA